jgi:hypothetical protein
MTDDHDLKLKNLGLRISPDPRVRPATIVNWKQVVLLELFDSTTDGVDKAEASFASLYGDRLLSLGGEDIADRKKIADTKSDEFVKACFDEWFAPDKRAAAIDRHINPEIGLSVWQRVQLFYEQFLPRKPKPQESTAEDVDTPQRGQSDVEGDKSTKKNVTQIALAKFCITQAQAAQNWNESQKKRKLRTLRRQFNGSRTGLVPEAPDWVIQTIVAITQGVLRPQKQPVTVEEFCGLKFVGQEAAADFAKWLRTGEVTPHTQTSLCEKIPFVGTDLRFQLIGETLNWIGVDAHSTDTNPDQGQSDTAHELVQVIATKDSMSGLSAFAGELIRQAGVSTSQPICYLPVSRKSSLKGIPFDPCLRAITLSKLVGQLDAFYLGRSMSRAVSPKAGREYEQAIRRIRRAMSRRPAILIFDGYQPPIGSDKVLSEFIADDGLPSLIRKISSPRFGSTANLQVLQTFQRNKILVLANGNDEASFEGYRLAVSQEPTKMLPEPSSDAQEDLRDIFNVPGSKNATTIAVSLVPRRAPLLAANETSIRLLDLSASLDSTATTRLDDTVHRLQTEEGLGEFVRDLLNELHRRSPRLVWALRLLAIAESGLRLETLSSVLHSLDRLNKSDDEIPPNVEELKKLLSEYSQIIVIGGDERFLGLDEIAPVPDAIDFSSRAISEAFAKPLLSVPDDEMAVHPWQTSKRELWLGYRALAEAALLQQSSILRLGAWEDQFHVRHFRRMIEALFYGLKSLSYSRGEDWHQTGEAHTNHIPTDDRAAFRYLYGVIYRQVLQCPPDFNLTRRLGRPAISAELLQLTIGAGSDLNVDAISTTPPILPSLETLHTALKNIESGLSGVLKSLEAGVGDASELQDVASRELDDAISKFEAMNLNDFAIVMELYAALAKNSNQANRLDLSAKAVEDGIRIGDVWFADEFKDIVLRTRRIVDACTAALASQGLRSDISKPNELTALIVDRACKCLAGTKPVFDRVKRSSFSLKKVALDLDILNANSGKSAASIEAEVEELFKGRLGLPSFTALLQKPASVLSAGSFESFLDKFPKPLGYVSCLDGHVQNAMQIADRKLDGPLLSMSADFASRVAEAAALGREFVQKKQSAEERLIGELVVFERFHVALRLQEQVFEADPLGKSARLSAHSTRKYIRTCLKIQKRFARLAIWLGPLSCAEKDRTHPENPDLAAVCTGYADYFEALTRRHLERLTRQSFRYANERPSLLLLEARIAYQLDGELERSWALLTKADDLICSTVYRPRLLMRLILERLKALRAIIRNPPPNWPDKPSMLDLADNELARLSEMVTYFGDVPLWRSTVDAQRHKMLELRQELKLNAT